MPSLIVGYNYDIFISYRQKDNKGDRWVSEFVDALKTELESTFKEEISVYFDINPHDGLLETHDVDESLKEKLKCLVFIPIISRTYCDPKSFAWEHEFKAFVEQSSKDQFGLKVKLPNGNVASRVLPVRIYDLDTADIKLCESVLGSVLRGVEFVYKSTGVNRPLRSMEENPQENLNHTIYRDQINKVGNALKDIITAMEKHEQRPVMVSKERIKPVPVRQKSNKALIIGVSITILTLIIIGLFFIPKLFKPSVQYRKSIAVLPFINDSPDSANLIFCNWMMEDILDKLAKVEELDVKSRTDVEPYRGLKKSIKEIGRELGVENILEGSIRKQGNRFKISLQLINCNSGFHLWSDAYEGEYSEKIWTIQSDIAQQVATALEVKLTRKEKESVSKLPTIDIRAYNYFLRATDEIEKFWGDHDPVHMRVAQGFLNTALEIDPHFEGAMSYKVLTYFGLNKWDSVLIFADKLLKINPNSAYGYYLKGYSYSMLKKPDLSIENYMLSIKNYAKKDSISKNRDEFYLGHVYCVQKHDYKNGLPWIQKSLSMESDFSGVKYFMIGCIFLDMGDYDRANKYLERSCKYEITPLLIELYVDNLIFQSKYEEALSFQDSVCNNLESSVRCFHSRLKICLAQKQYDRALEYYKQLLTLGGTLEILDYDISDSTRIAYLYQVTGQNSLSRTVLQKCLTSFERKTNEGPEYLRFFNLSMIYAMMDRKADAVNCLSKAFDLGLRGAWFDYAEVYPVFENLRDVPEFKALLMKVRSEKAAYRAQVNEMVKQGEIHL
jgi:TolB-like protein/tetratricopeptide (TPR) repeat protein